MTNPLLGPDFRKVTWSNALGGIGELISETWLSGLPPCFPETVPVEQPQDSAHEQKHALVERPRYGQETDHTAPSERPGDAAVASQQPDGADRSQDEGACGSHAASLGREGHCSRFGERHGEAGEHGEVGVKRDPPKDHGCGAASVRIHA